MSKDMGIIVKFWLILPCPFTKYVRSCHVTQVANFEIFNVGQILHLILVQVTKFLVENFSNSEVSSQKLYGRRGLKTIPCAFRVKWVNRSDTEKTRTNFR